MSRFARYLQMLGPGLLYAGAAIGVSHLVQSTRAGAVYGFELAWVILAAHLLKYPAFEFAPRFAAATGLSLVEGYHRIGRWALAVFALLQVLTMFAVLAAITMVTAGLFGNIFKLGISNTLLSTIILIISTTVLVAGRYALLDKLIKVIILLLGFSTIAALIFALGGEHGVTEEFSRSFDWRQGVDIAFIIAFVGWMPAPIDLSVMHSQWSVAKAELKGRRPGLRESLIDFRTGYFGTAILAFCFLALGALVMYGSGESPSETGIVFAGQLLQMYTLNLGQWAYPLIAAAALTTMFSTTITVIDAYPRVLEPATILLVKPGSEAPNEELIDDTAVAESESSALNFRLTVRYFWMALLVGGSITLISYMAASMRFMVDLATTLSFTISPILAWFNYLAVNNRQVAQEFRPPRWLNTYAVLSVILLTLFSIIFILWRFQVI